MPSDGLLKKQNVPLRPYVVWFSIKAESDSVVKSVFLKTSERLGKEFLVNFALLISVVSYMPTVDNLH